MDKRYDHNSTEDKIYKLWEKSGFFNPDNLLRKKTTNNKQQITNNSKSTKRGAQKSKNWDLKSRNFTQKPFCVIMPPPNANDPLHLGHAMFVAIEDMMIRYHRMLGDDTLWLPGTDHAGIETQFVFEKKLKKEGKSRFNFDREALYKKIWDYVQENSETAISQMKKLGASADWSRSKFTLDPNIVNTVLDTFKKLHEDGLVYRDLKLVNYCPKCGTAFSELEINHQEKNSKLYYLKYGPFTIATTRPETIFGDIAVAVHPDDKRYQKYIGQEIEVNYLIEKRKVKVIADKYVDPEFGTGAVKITPLHDHNDYELWQRHKNKLELPKQVINHNGRLNQHAGKYRGLKSHIAREEIAKDLETANLLTRTTKNDYQNKVSTCYRCNTAIEPLPLPQFFIKVKPMVEKTLNILDKKQVKIHGAGHDKILRHWLKNLKDWNISRQIVWGIRMPIWYDVEKNPDIEVVFLDKNGGKKSGKISELLQDDKYQILNISVGLQNLSAPMGAKYIVSKNSPGESYLQETDTFDTWFSSGQWPFATLQNSKKGDFERFYPTSVMETAYDILPFWIMRMLMLGVHITGKTPFRDVYFHGLIRDQKGQKMSKSKGNTINPLEVVDKYGADALRMALIIRSSAGLDKSVREADFRAARNFCNKLWNASRFISMNLEISDPKSQNQNGKEFFEKLNKIITIVSKQLNDFKFGLATDTLYNEFWHWYCDECIELNKQGKLGQTQLVEGLEVFLKLLHPIIPFTTESIWQELQKNHPNKLSSKLLMTTPWPTNNDK
ncbi:MAG: valine--tRNA ligase [Patescibacteria group bacterium]